MKNEEKPLVSIVITNYNYSKYLYQSIESAINQTYKNTEILLIDDASTDNSEDVWKKFSGSIRVIKHTKNKGIVFSRNEALDIIKGKYFIFLDSDDYWDIDYLEKQVIFIEKTHFDVVYTDIKAFGMNNNDIKFPNFSLDRIISRNIVNMGALIRRSSVKYIRFDPELNRTSHEDWDFFLALALEGKKIQKNKSAKLNYRIHNNHRNEKKDIIENYLNLVKVNAYIVEKYRKKYPERVNFSKENEVIEIYSNTHNDLINLRNVADSYRRDINNMNSQISKKDILIKDQNSEIQRILNSKSYKIGLKITNTIKFPKKILKRIIGEKGGK